MIIDSSAIVSILLGEDDDSRMLAAIASATDRRMAAPSWLETALVFVRRTAGASRELLSDLIARWRIEIVPFDAEQAVAARDAYSRYGGRPARLNFGDCMAYALAKITGEPLLFKGNDFPQTDIISALPG